MNSCTRIFLLYFILFFLKFDFVYSQSPKEFLSIIYRIIQAGEWVNKITINNQKVKVFYIRVETTAPTFEQAKEKNFTLAIQEALGTFVLSEKVVKFEQIVRDDIVMYSGGYVQDFKIIEEKKGPSSTTLLMDVWVSESRIANRLLNTSANKGELDGTKIAAQLSTIVKDKHDAFKLLEIILQDFPFKAFELDIKKINFQTLRKGTSIVEIPIEIQWSQKYLDSLKEALLILRDGNELRFSSNIFYGKNYIDGVTISIASQIFNTLTFSGIDASFENDEKIDLFYLHFKDAPTIKITLNDDFENEIITDCFYLQNRGNLNVKSKYDKQNIHETLSLDEFYEFNTHRAHLEINEKYQQKKKFPIKLTSKNLNKISEITKVKASIIKNSDCKN